MNKSDFDKFDTTTSKGSDGLFLNGSGDTSAEKSLVDTNDFTNELKNRCSVLSKTLIDERQKSARLKSKLQKVFDIYFCISASDRIRLSSFSIYAFLIFSCFISFSTASVLRDLKWL